MQLGRSSARFRRRLFVSFCCDMAWLAVRGALALVILQSCVTDHLDVGYGGSWGSFLRHLSGSLQETQLNLFSVRLRGLVAFGGIRRSLLDFMVARLHFIGALGSQFPARLGGIDHYWKLCPFVHRTTFRVLAECAALPGIHLATVHPRLSSSGTDLLCFPG